MVKIVRCLAAVPLYLSSDYWHLLARCTALICTPLLLITLPQNWHFTIVIFDIKYTKQISGIL